MTTPRTIEDRKQDLYAAQSLSATLAREIYEAQQRQDPDTHIGALIEQKAQAEALWLRLSQEVHAETMSANLLTFLNRQDDGNARVVAAIEEVARGLKKRLDDLEAGQGLLAHQIGDLGERLSETDLAVVSFRESRDQSIEERRQHREEIDQLRKAYTALSAQIASALALSAQASSLLALTDYAIITIDESQHIIFANEEAEALFGYARGELVGQLIDILIPTRFRGAHQWHIESFAAGPDASRRMAERQPIAGRHKDGREIPIRAAISKQAGADGQMTYAVVLRATNGATREVNGEQVGGDR